MAAITIDSPRWREGWGESIRHTPAARPDLRVVAGGTGVRRPDRPAYGRRRVVAALVVVVLVALVALGATSLLTRPAAAGTPAAAVRATHVVQPGETYWSIAAGLEHDGDLRVFVDRLVDANGGRTLVAGERIELPSR